MNSREIFQRETDLFDQRLIDLLNQDLSGWQITYCYVLELANLDKGWRNRCLAVTDGGGIIIITPDKESLLKVWRRMSQRRDATITKFLVIANLNSGVGFLLNNLRETEIEPLTILSSSDIDELLQEDIEFVWSNGWTWGPMGRLLDPVE